VTGTGAGAASRQSVGAAVFAGMIGVTTLGIFFTPALYVLMQKRWKKDREPPSDGSLTRSWWRMF
jgi:Cu/Ag efflux pump CusA